MNKLIKKLESMLACPEAIRWLKAQPSPRSAWETCKDGSRSMWLVERLFADIDRLRVVLAACDCAELAFEWASPNDLYVLVNCVEVARAWAMDGGRTSALNEVELAGVIALDADTAVGAAVCRASDVAHDSRTAHYLIEAILNAAPKEAKRRTLSKCADVVREHFSYAEVARALKKAT